MCHGGIGGFILSGTLTANKTCEKCGTLVPVDEFEKHVCPEAPIQKFAQMSAGLEGHARVD